MANLNNLISKIIANAEKKKEQILTSAEAERQAILERYEEKAREEIKVIIEEAEKDAAEQRERLISKSALEIRDDIAREKQAQIHKAFQSALQQLKAMDENEFKQFLKKVAFNTGFKGEAVLTIGEENPFTDAAKTINEMNIELASEGSKLILSNETLNGISGFVIEQNGIEINCCFEDLVDFMEEELGYEVATILWR